MMMPCHFNLPQPKNGFYFLLPIFIFLSVSTIFTCFISNVINSQERIQDLAMGGGGGKISSEGSYIYERSEYKSAVSPPTFFLNLEPLRVNLSVI